MRHMASVGVRSQARMMAVCAFHPVAAASHWARMAVWWAVVSIVVESMSAA